MGQRVCLTVSSILGVDGRHEFCPAPAVLTRRISSGIFHAVYTGVFEESMHRGRVESWKGDLCLVMPRQALRAWELLLRLNPERQWLRMHSTVRSADKEK